MRSFEKEIRSFLFSKKIKCLILSKDNWLINGLKESDGTSRTFFVVKKSFRKTKTYNFTFV